MIKYKIYLSPAAHLNDNKTQCPCQCSENTHCNQYMDLVEEGLKACGFDVKRGDKSLSGSTAMSTRVKEANKWGCDLYYVAHTNAGGGRYSMTMYYKSDVSQKYAQILHNHRLNENRHVLRVKSDLYEIRMTKAVCLYDELFFHDNAEDCKWFHEDGMKIMAQETVDAICEIFGVKKQEVPTPQPEPEPVRTIKVGSKVRVRNGAKDYNGTQLASFVYSRDHVVRQINNDRVVITYNGVVVAAVKIEDLIAL